MAEKVVENGFFTMIESDVVDVSTEIELSKIDAIRPHCFVGVQFFSDAEGQTAATPSAGTIAVQVKTVNSNIYETLDDSPIDLTAICTKNWAGNTRQVKATPNGVTDAAYWKLVVTCNTT